MQDGEDIPPAAAARAAMEKKRFGEASCFRDALYNPGFFIYSKK